MKTNEPRRAEEGLGAILSEIAEGRVKLYRNFLRQPYVYCDHPKYPGLHLHLLDKDIRSWLTHFIWETKKLLLREREIDRILEEWPGGLCPSRSTKSTIPLSSSSSNPNRSWRSSSEFMHTRERHETTMEVARNLYQPAGVAHRGELLPWFLSRHSLLPQPGTCPTGCSP